MTNQQAIALASTEVRFTEALCTLNEHLPKPIRWSNEDAVTFNDTWADLTPDQRLLWLSGFISGIDSEYEDKMTMISMDAFDEVEDDEDDELLEDLVNVDTIEGR